MTRCSSLVGVPFRKLMSESNTREVNTEIMTTAKRRHNWPVRYMRALHRQGFDLNIDIWREMFLVVFG